MRLSLDWWDRYIDWAAPGKIAEDTEFLMTFVRWSPWFAWRPVAGRGVDGGIKQLVWLEPVERSRVCQPGWSPKDCLGAFNAFGDISGWRWEYRLP